MSYFNTLGLVNLLKYETAYSPKIGSHPGAKDLKSWFAVSRQGYEDSPTGKVLFVDRSTADFQKEDKLFSKVEHLIFRRHKGRYSYVQPGDSFFVQTWNGNFLRGKDGFTWLVEEIDIENIEEYLWQYNQYDGNQLWNVKHGCIKLVDSDTGLVLELCTDSSFHVFFVTEECSPTRLENFVRKKSFAKPKMEFAPLVAMERQEMDNALNVVSF